VSALVSTLNPQPGSHFSRDESRYLTPDLTVQRIGNDWVVTMNDDWLPSVRISNTYKDILGQSDHKGEVKSYVRERLRAAKFFIKSIHQRQQTIQRIAGEIVRVQRDFLDNGREFLKPLTMTEVAQWIGVHETTVSRAIANKSIRTPQGVYELKYFFTPGVRLLGGGSITPDQIKTEISTFVADEPAEKPLSDQDLMEFLKQKGIPIARRTVAKYREELKILPSHLRRTKSSSNGVSG
jgi:RNA polymerase sigma-54 factor